MRKGELTMRGVWMLAGVVAVLTTVSAGTPPPREAQVGTAPGDGMAGRPSPGSQARATTVIGYVWEADNTPIPRATLRLREALTGSVRGGALSDDSGRFTFADVESGTYVIEYVDNSGKVAAVGYPFSVSRGETVATFVRLAARQRWFAGLFGTSGTITQVAAASVAAAASLGITAVGAPGRAASFSK